MNCSVVNSRQAQLSIAILLFSVFTLTGALPVLAQITIQPKPTSLFLPLITSPAQSQSSNTPAKVHEDNIPAGTILPVVLRTSFSLDKCKPGQILRGKIAQDVPLPNGSTIHRSSQIEGHIVQVAPAANGTGATVSFNSTNWNWLGSGFPLSLT